METPSLEEIARRYTRRTVGGIHIPIVRQVTEASDLTRRFFLEDMTADDDLIVE